MRKSMYYLRVLIVSPEFFVLLVSWVVHQSYHQEISNYLTTVDFDPEALKWVILLPVTISGWMLKEGVSILFPDENTQKILHEWKEYWRLRAHFDIGVFFAIVLLAPCVYVWLTKSFSTGWGISIFVACVISLLCSGFSFYNARLKVREILLRAK